MLRSKLRDEVALLCRKYDVTTLQFLRAAFEVAELTEALNTIENDDGSEESRRQSQSQARSRSVPSVVDMDPTIEVIPEVSPEDWDNFRKLSKVVMDDSLSHWKFPEEYHFGVEVETYLIKRSYIVTGKQIGRAHV